MTDPTPFPTDPLEAEGTDPDLSTDDDSPQTTTDAGDAASADAAPRFDEQQRDRQAAAEQHKGDRFTDIP